MKRIRLCILVLAAAQAFSCVSFSHASHERLMRDMDRIKKEILRGKDPAALCRGKKAGNSGFYYLIDKNGIILCHPKSFLDGTSFNNNRFVREIVEKKSGCFRYKLGQTEFSIYYRDITENVILCLSMATAEINNGALSCPELK